jgi:CCR4-NOT transcription complex subunit 9
MATLLQEILNLYQYLSPSKLNKEKSDRASHILSLFQEIALNSKTRKEFLESQLLVFLYPFLNISSRAKIYDVIRLSALGVIAALVKRDDSVVIIFLLNTGIIPILLKIIERGTDLSRTIAFFILHRIVYDSKGFSYICEMKERLHAITYILGMIMHNKISQRLKNYILKIFVLLIENKEAKNMIKQESLDKIKDENFIISLDDSSKDKVKKILKSFQDDELGNDIKIKKLKNDLTNKNNNNVQNINIVNNNINIYNNNGNQNVNNGDMNNNMNLNMMFINNMNQMKIQPGYMISPSMGDFNYNICNDNENYMNNNIYNQNTNNGYGNLNFFNGYKNI